MESIIYRLMRGEFPGNIGGPIFNEKNEVVGEQ
jgi:hypothetical protein